MSKFVTRLEPEKVYHIWTHAINNENLFHNNENYLFFLKKYHYYIHPIAETYAYCLMPNHLHLMVRFKDNDQIITKNKEDLSGFQNLTGLFSKKFSNLFNSYAKASNKMYNRKGPLFIRPFKRLEISSDLYFGTLVAYIHLNPVQHGFVNHPEEWPFSSYHSYLSSKPTHLARKEGINWFGNRRQFVKLHHEIRVEKLTKTFEL